MLLRLAPNWWKHLSQVPMLRYAATSTLSGVITLSVAFAMREGVQFSDSKAGGVAFVCAFVVNFVVIRKFVFSVKGAWTYQLAKFAFISGAFRIGEYVLYLLLLYIGLHYFPAIVIVLFSATCLKFVAYKHAVFNGWRWRMAPKL
jgi:putative flippase GtrA